MSGLRTRTEDFLWEHGRMGVGTARMETELNYLDRRFWGKGHTISEEGKSIISFIGGRF